MVVIDLLSSDDDEVAATPGLIQPLVCSDSDDDDIQVVDPSGMKPTIQAQAEVMDTDLAVVGTNGEGARDWPHARADCLNHPFKTTNKKDSICDKCMCFVCETFVKDCKQWAAHCQAFNSSMWKKERKNHKLGLNSVSKNVGIKTISFAFDGLLSGIVTLKRGLSRNKFYWYMKKHLGAENCVQVDMHTQLRVLFRKYQTDCDVPAETPSTSSNSVVNNLPCLGFNNVGSEPPTNLTFFMLDSDPRALRSVRSFFRNNHSQHDPYTTKFKAWVDYLRWMKSRGGANFSEMREEILPERATPWVVSGSQNRYPVHAATYAKRVSEAFGMFAVSKLRFRLKKFSFREIPDLDNAPNLNWTSFSRFLTTENEFTRMKEYIGETPSEDLIHHLLRSSEEFSMFISCAYMEDMCSFDMLKLLSGIQNCQIGNSVTFTSKAAFEVSPGNHLDIFVDIRLHISSLEGFESVFDDCMRLYLVDHPPVALPKEYEFSLLDGPDLIYNPNDSLKISQSLMDQYLLANHRGLEGVRSYRKLMDAGIIHHGYKAATQPEGLHVSMHGYQKQNLQWMLDQENGPGGVAKSLYAPLYLADGKKLYYSASCGRMLQDRPPPIKGGMLCDEMGMGKTISTLALVLANRSPPSWTGSVPSIPSEAKLNAIIAAIPREKVGTDRLELLTDVVMKLAIDSHVDLLGYQVSGRVGIKRRLPMNAEEFKEFSMELSDCFLPSFPVVTLKHGRVVLTFYVVGCLQCGCFPLPGEMHCYIHYRMMVPSELREELFRKRKAVGLKTNDGTTFRQWLVRYLELIPQKVRDSFPPFETNRSLATSIVNQFYQRAKASGTLVVCHTSLVKQWTSEASTRSGGSLKILAYYGASRSKFFDKLHEYDIVVTTYGILASDSKKNGPSQSHLPSSTFVPPTERYIWHRIVLDESHMIKNKSKIYAGGVMNLHASFRWCMSGTPWLNDLMDLHAQLRFLQIPEFDSETIFKQNLIKPEGCVIAIIKSFLIRHVKSQKFGEESIVTLPSKTFTRLGVDLAEEEKNIYQEKEQSLYETFLPLMTCISSTMKKMSMLRELRAMCTTFRVPLQMNNELNQNNKRTLESSGITSSRTTDSSKVTALFNALKAMISEYPSSKALAFCDFSSDEIQSMLMREGIPFRTLFLMDPVRRRKIVEEFDTDKTIKVLLLSSRVGAVGINLTAANFVYIVEPFLKQGLENQAIDRTHRLGQTKPVHVIQMFAKGTVEEKMLILRDRKSDQEQEDGPVENNELVDGEEEGNRGVYKETLQLHEYIFLFKPS